MGANRAEKKVKIYDIIFDKMVLNDKFCGDNVHDIEIEVFKDKYGIELTAEQIIYLASIIRTRRHVLVNNPYLDTRVKNKSLEDEDRQFYAQDKL